MPNLDAERLTLNAKRGFSLIELMVVVSLFGIAASLITASYLTFERNQRVRSAAEQLKSDLRLVQNKATSGDKGPQAGNPSDTVCPKDSILGGWYLYANADINIGSITSYKFGGVCVTALSEVVFLEKTINLPADTKINRIFYNAGDLNQPTTFFFRPLNSGVTYHNGVFAPPDFFEADGITLRNEFPPIDLPSDSWVAIEVSNMSTPPNRFYWVRIETTGEINEVKP